MPQFNVFRDPDREALDRQIRLAEFLRMQGLGPIQDAPRQRAPVHVLQGLAQVLKSYASGAMEHETRKREKEREKRRQQELSFALKSQPGLKPNDPSQPVTRGSIADVLAGSQFPQHQQLALNARLGEIESQNQLRLAESRKAQANMTPSMGEKEYRYFQTLTPEQQKQYLDLKRAPQVLNLGGSQVLLDPTRPEGTPSAEFPVTPKPEQTPEHRGKVTEAEKQAVLQVEKTKLFPKAEAARRAARIKWDFVESKIDDALGLVSEWTAGPAGALDWIPGSDPRQLAQVLTTIRANIGFEELARMREASPTGGALGQVSEMENRLLQAVQGSLDNLQKPSALRKNLEDIKFYNRALREELDRAFEKDFSDFLPEDESNNTDTGPSQEDIEFTAKKYGISIDEVKRRLGLQ